MSTHSLANSWLPARASFRAHRVRAWAQFAGVVLIAVSSSLGGSTARADLHFPEPMADAGMVYAGAPLVHAFGFTNQGPEIVSLLEARASCGCLRPRFDLSTYQPGAHGAIILEINTLSQATGPHVWTITLRYQTGTVVREARLQLKGRLVTEVTVQPAALVVFADKIAHHELILTDPRAQPLQVRSVHASSAQLVPRLEDVRRDAQGRMVQTIHLAVTDDYPEGRHEETLTIATDDRRYAELRVPVTILKRAQQRLTATPGQVELVGPAGQALPARLVLVRDEQGQAVHIDQVWAEDPTLLCHWAAGPGALATLKVRTERKLAPGERWQSAIHLRIDQPVPETLTLPVTVQAR